MTGQLCGLHEFLRAEPFHDAHTAANRARAGMENAGRHEDGVMFELYLRDAEAAIERMHELTGTGTARQRRLGIFCIVFYVWLAGVISYAAAPRHPILWGVVGLDVAAALVMGRVLWRMRWTVR